MVIHFTINTSCGDCLYLFSLEDSGFIVIGRGAWTIETRLSVFILALVLGVLAIYTLFRLLLMLWRLPLRLFHNQQKADESLVRGFLALIQGQWQNAEHSLLKTVSVGELSVLHYLGAASAAYQQQAQSVLRSIFLKHKKVCLKRMWRSPCLKPN